MAIIISGANGIDMGNKPISNTSQLDSTVINENGENVATISNLTSFKNYLINGNFDILQYKDSGLTYPQTSSGYGSDDRWANSNSGSTKSHSIVNVGDTERVLFNASYFSRTIVSSIAGVSNYVSKIQYIENINKLAGKTVTISFWAKADSNKNIAIELVQQFGSGGTPSALVSGIGSQIVALTTTWQKKIVTLAVPNLVGKTLGTDGPHTSATSLHFWFDAGSSFNSRAASLWQQSGTFDIAQVQIEEGLVATPFEQRHYELELSLCQRYFEYEAGGCAIKCEQAYDNRGATQLEGAIKFNVKKRVSPSINSVTFNSGSYSSIPRITTNGVIIQSTGSSTASSVYINSYSASAEFI